MCLKCHESFYRDNDSLANEIVEMFYKWYLGPLQGTWQLVTSYFPTSGCEPFPHSSIIRQQIDNANKFYNKNKNKCREEMVKLLSKDRDISKEDDADMIIGDINENKSTDQEM